MEFGPKENESLHKKWGREILWVSNKEGLGKNWRSHQTRDEIECPRIAGLNGVDELIDPKMEIESKIESCDAIVPQIWNGWTSWGLEGSPKWDTLTSWEPKQSEECVWERTDKGSGAISPRTTKREVRGPSSLWWWWYCSWNEPCDRSTSCQVRRE